MLSINFIHPDASSEVLNGREGDSAMYVATLHDLDEILAECGGNAMCATCHVYVDDAWASKLPAMSDAEDALLDGTASERRPNSRLSCQIRLTPDLDGLILHLPERQV